MKRIRTTVIISIFFLLLLPSIRVEASSFPSYNYDFFRDTVPSKPSFDVERIVYIGDLEGVYNFGDIADLDSSNDRVFIADKTGSQVVVTDHDLEFVTRITLLKDIDGNIVMNGDKQERISKPEGVYVTKDGDLYIADTGYDNPEIEGTSGRIIQLSPGIDPKNNNPFYYLKRIIYEPQNMVSSNQFIPQKIAVDNANRIYTIIKGGNEGIIEMNPDGTFSRYFGTTQIRVNLWNYFWKQLASDEQRQKMNLTFAPPYNNLDIDKNGFIYTTNSDPDVIDKIQRINPSGINVIREFGYFKPIGDIKQSNSQKPSIFSAISVNEFGMYAALDSQNKKVFVYNFDGELLFILGEGGGYEGALNKPSDVAWVKDKIIVSDEVNRSIIVYKPTRFGEEVLRATEAYENGQWDVAGEHWQEAIKLNANYDIAYVGYGKILYMQEAYEEAMENFKLGNNRSYYSMAFREHRNTILQENFLLFISPLILLVGWVLVTEMIYNRKEGKNEWKH